jgi:hypothetical protein
MTTLAPLVIKAGVVQQLQSGDMLTAGVAVANTRSLTNGEASAAIVIGAPVYISGAASVKRAQANASSTATVFGLGYDVSTAFGAAGNIITSGVLVATTAQWDAVAGTSGGLTAGTVYYLDPATVGKITATAPSNTGQLVVPVGIAISTTDMEVDIGDPILL